MKRSWFMFAVVPLLLSTQTAKADNDYQGLPPPQSADELVTSFDQGLAGQEETETPVDQIVEKSHLKLKLRNYYLNRTRDDNTDPKAWAQGGSVEYRLEKVGGFFDLNVEYFGSFKLWGPDKNDGTLLLEPSQNNIDTLGVLNPRLTWEHQVVSLYRQKIDLPFINQQDNRMIPNTFEAYTLSMPKTENETFQYGTGYIANIKKRNDEAFIPMSEAAGTTGADRGVIFGGARYYITPDLSLGAIDHFAQDVMNIAYSEAIYKKKIDDDMANTASAQFAYEGSTGDNLLNGGQSFSTNFWGVQDAFSYKNVTLKVAGTIDDSGADISSPWGSYPGYNSVTVEDFNRAGEKAWQVYLGYNFKRLGMKELGIAANYVHGLDAIDPTTKVSIPNKDETDVTLDYKVADGMLKGFWVRLRSAFIEEENKGSTEDYRIIVNYEIPLYEPEPEEKADDKKKS